MSRRVLDVGQCSYDHGHIRLTIQQHFQAEVHAAYDGTDALAQLRAGPFDLVLINRLLDGDGSSGLNVLQQIKSDAALTQLPVMLVSNYAEAQAAAVAAGAVPGFGKNDLGSSAALEKLRLFLE